VDAFTVHSGTALPLRRSNVDTDQIIPAEYLKRVSRTGFEDGLFAAWRTDPEFVLNEPRYAGSSVLIAGPDFGTGSSREHAVWALLDYGFKVVLSSRFGDIFRGNASKAGLLAAQIEEPIVKQIWAMVEADPSMRVTVDLRTLRVQATDLTAPFAIDDYTRWRLLGGLDDIDVTMSYEAEIVAYERTRPLWRPTTS
jgi:3-isopropylmalate/(R)-2-methylmalate dehydratase small subunit